MTYEELCKNIAALNGDRLLIALAGAPASGKSTLAETLASEFEGAVVPMDGFHFDDDVLRARGDLARKGAPHTFDIGGLVSLLKRLRENQESEIAIPRFDRALEISRAGAMIIPQSTRYLFVEGNYLLLNQGRWRELRPLFDLRIFVDVPEAVILERLRARWQGFGYDSRQIEAKINENDLPNAQLVRASSSGAQFSYANVSENEDKAAPRQS